MLDLLATLGRGWMRLAMLDRVRAQRGDLTTNVEVSGVLASDHHARALLGAWTGDIQAAFYGKGEAALIAAGQRTSAPEAVSMQILGALSLVTASQAPADALLERVSFSPLRPEPDWATLLSSALKREPEIVRSSSGPDHDKTFTVTVTANGLSVSATGRSFKAARKAAARSYVLQYLPHAAPGEAPGRTQTHPAPRLYRGDFPQHVRAVRWAQQAFEVADAAWMSQALTHRSWIQENRAVVTEANQRDYGALATEGSEVLTTLVRHHYVLQTLGASSRLATTVATHPAVSREVVLTLFDAMPVEAGVLRSKGMRQLSLDVKEDVTQAIAAASVFSLSRDTEHDVSARSWPSPKKWCAELSCAKNSRSCSIDPVIGTARGNLLGWANRARRFQISAKSSTLPGSYATRILGPYFADTSRCPHEKRELLGNPWLYPPLIPVARRVRVELTAEARSNLPIRATRSAADGSPSTVSTSTTSANVKSPLRSFRLLLSRFRPSGRSPKTAR